MGETPENSSTYSKTLQATAHRPNQSLGDFLYLILSREMTQISLTWGCSSVSVAGAGSNGEHRETGIPDLTKGAHPCPGDESQVAEPGEKTSFYESNMVFWRSKPQPHISPRAQMAADEKSRYYSPDFINFPPPKGPQIPSPPSVFARFNFGAACGLVGRCQCSAFRSLPTKKPRKMKKL